MGSEELVGSVEWSQGSWSTPPASAEVRADGSLVVTAVEGSDHWSRTAYGFVHADSHALLAPFAVGSAVEVSFRGDFVREFDQAGVFVSAGDEQWIKAGVEYADGHLGIGAVVTAGLSDWSVGRADDWAGAEITVRVSRWADSVIVRARAAGGAGAGAADAGEWRLIRVAPFDGALDATAGPFVAAPTRSGLAVTFTSWRTTESDTSIH